jgi:Mg-chelatase subunit ChlD
MLSLLFVAAFVAPPAHTTAPTFAVGTAVGIAAAPQAKGDKSLKALETWLKLYRAGRIDFRSKNNIANESIAMKYGLTAKDAVGSPTWAGDLDVILEHVAKLGDDEAVQALVEVAAVGLESDKYTYAQAPGDVRAVAEKWLGKLKSETAVALLGAGARGEWRGDKNRSEAMRAAAVTGLGALKLDGNRAVLAQTLGDASPLVRIHAAQALATLGSDAAVPALLKAVAAEQDEPALMSAVQALHTLCKRHKTDAGALSSDDKGAAAKEKAAAALPEHVATVAQVVRGALLRCSWRADMQILDLLEDFRFVDTVPALIGVLEHYHKNPGDLKTGRLSGLLLYRAHELLVGMTGAAFSADQPDRWRALWENDKDKIAARKPADKPHQVTTAAFAGIPVTGTRVVFVLDLSGSMEWPMEEVGADGKTQRLVRLDYAKRELHRAADALPDNAWFNLVTFNGSDRAEKWNKDLVAANPTNRERFKKFVDRLRPLGGTNLWSGLEEAMRIKGPVHGSQHQSTVDEIFVLSDGAPTVGEVTDPVEILRLVEECNRFAKARIHTVFISSATPAEMRQTERGLSLAPKELMKRLAEQNGGRFRDV